MPIHTAVAECLNLFSIPKRMAWHLSFSVPTRRLSSIQQYASHLQVIIDKLYQYAIIVSLSRHVPSCPESHARPPSGPSNSFNVIAPAPATLLSSRTNKANSHSPYVLPSSVSRKSIVCHCYENSLCSFRYNGELLHGSIPDKWLESQLGRYGFCGQEYKDIRRQLDQFGRANIVV